MPCGRTGDLKPVRLQRELLKITGGCLKSIINLITERDILPFLSLNDLFSPKMAREDYTSSAIFVILWAIASSPHSIFTLSVPRK